MALQAPPTPGFPLKLLVALSFSRFSEMKHHLQQDWAGFFSSTHEAGRQVQSWAHALDFANTRIDQKHFIQKSSQASPVLFLDLKNAVHQRWAPRCVYSRLFKKPCLHFPTIFVWWCSVFMVLTFILKSYFLDLKTNFSAPPPTSMAASPDAYLQGNIRMTLEDAELWRTFHEIGTEMIITKPGR